MSCLNPFKLKTGEQVPCCKCLTCLKRRASAWSFRLMNESKKTMSSHFITLTYDTKHVPITPKGYMSLDHGKSAHLVLFFKRLRKSCMYPGRASIKYFAVGEYGGKTKRPHYHVLLFNAPIEEIQKAWHYGEVHYGKVSGASIGYCLKYMLKKGQIPAHRNDDRQPEYARMSKGIGLAYLTDKIKRWHKADLENRMYVPLEDGKKASMPRYYKDKMYTTDERARVAAAQQKILIEKQILDYMENGYEAVTKQKKIIQKECGNMLKKAAINSSIKDKL